MSSYSSLFGTDTFGEDSTGVTKNKTVTRKDLKKDYPNTNEEKTWEFDALGSGLKSTQQIQLDWSNFANHTFFHSAEVKVNAAYERMVNYFPYDGSLEEIMDFISDLTGWEKYVLDLFPKYMGYLNFNSSIFISIKDSQGYLFPTLAKKNTLQSVLGTDATKSGYTLECFIHPPTGVTTKNQVIFQKLSSDSNTGITLALSSSVSSADSIEVHSLLSSGSDNNVYVLHTSASITKGEFTHIATVFDKDLSNTLNILKNGVLVDTSPSALEINSLDFIQSNILIGSGSNQATGSIHPENSTWWAEQLLTGSLDELRFWTFPKKHQNISSSIEYSVEETNGLGLYLKFNEPTGSYASNNMVLDSSGNGLHGYITNYGSINRIAEIDLPVKYENPDHHPVLFPDYPTLTSKNIALLHTASNYDVINPNYILKLVPTHYLEADLIQPADPGLLPEYTSSIAIPGGGKMPSNQIIAHFLFMWAAFFDDLKLHIDAFKDIAALNYQDLDGIPAQAIHQVAKQYGYDLPNMFTEATPEQFHLGRNLNGDILYGETSLKQILHSIWRRVTTEIPHINRAKGTVSSISMLLNSFGIDADSNFRIREFGSTPLRKISNMRRERKKQLKFINFTTSSMMHMSSSNLLAYRWSPGFPPAYRDLRPTYNTATQAWNPAPKLVPLTSGSWSYEAGYKLNKVTSYATQSLMRLDMSASDGTTAPFVNILVYSGSSWYPDEYKVRLLVSTGSSGSLSSDPTPSVDLTLPGINMYDGDHWHIALTSEIIPQSSATNSEHSPGKGKISISATNANGSRIYTQKTTSSYYDIQEDHPFKAYRLTDGGGASSDFPLFDKPFLSFGKVIEGYQNRYLGSGSITDFNGSINSIRFWSKELNTQEIQDHALNPFSIGSADPIINSPFLQVDNPSLGVTGSHEHPRVEKDFNSNFGQISLNSGSWERLRLIGDIINSNTASDASGRANIVDLSRNAYHFGMSNAPTSSQIMTSNFVNYSVVEMNWDNPNVSNKIRIRSFQDEKLAEEHGAHHGSLTSLNPREIVADDKRFSIEASVAQAINEDISTLISDLFFLNNSIGAPELLYAVNYPDLDHLADKYFNRLEDKVDFRNYFDFFKWFDTSFSTMVENLIPCTTEFLGVNFVIESHVLERHKLQYQQADVHIDLSRRLAARIENLVDANIIKI